MFHMVAHGASMDGEHLFLWLLAGFVEGGVRVRLRGFILPRLSMVVLLISTLPEHMWPQRLYTRHCFPLQSLCIPTCDSRLLQWQVATLALIFYCHWFASWNPENNAELGRSEPATWRILTGDQQVCFDLSVTGCLIKPKVSEGYFSKLMHQLVLTVKHNIKVNPSMAW